MVAGMLVPDLPVAIIQRLKADSDVASLVGGRIAMAFPEGRRAWNMTSQSAILVRARGGPPPSLYDESRVSRIELHMYGAGDSPNTRRRISRLIWRTVEPVLCPPPNAGLAMGWLNQELRIIVRWIQPEMGEPLMMPEPDTNWDQAVMSYRVGWSALRRGTGIAREIPTSARLSQTVRLSRSVPVSAKVG